MNKFEATILINPDLTNQALEKELNSIKVNSNKILSSKNYLKNKNLDQIMLAKKNATENVFLKKNIPDIVYVYSENSSKSFLNIIKKYQLIDSWMNTNLMCIGEKTSSVLNEVKWKKIFLFSPGEEEFLLYKI